MDSDDDDDIKPVEILPIYRKGKEILDNAAIIRKAARDLIVQQHSLDMFGFEFIEYWQIVRDLVEEYRLLFIDWVAGFDKWDYIIDRWGLFNPPGVGPFDKDPDDDIPFRGFWEDPEK